jgi:hypothetical protein
MDYQPAVLGSLDDHDQLLTLASGAIDLARQAGITVAYVRLAFADEDYEQVPEANKMLAGVARSRALHHEAPESQIHGRLEPQPGDIAAPAAGRATSCWPPASSATRPPGKGRGRVRGGGRGQSWAMNMVTPPVAKFGTSAPAAWRSGDCAAAAKTS